MIESPVYKGTEMRFGSLLDNLKERNVDVQRLQSKPVPNSCEGVINEDVYLIDRLQFLQR